MIKQTWYQLPDEDCERLTRFEMQSVRWIMAALNILVNAEKPMADRLDCIPEGRRRFRLMLGQLRAVCNDLIGTTPREQCKQIQGVMKDMQLNLIPKLAPGSEKVVMDPKDLAYLIHHAQRDEELCQTCVKDGNECRKCKMYKMLVAVAPLPDYGSGMMCPYSGDWMHK